MIAGVIVVVADVFHHRDVHTILGFPLNPTQTHVLLEAKCGFLLDLLLASEGGCWLAHLVVYILDVSGRNVKLLLFLSGDLRFLYMPPLRGYGVVIVLFLHYVY